MSQRAIDPICLLKALAYAVVAWGVPLQAASQCDQNCGEVILGRPKLWALEDAQYLIGQTLERLKRLEVTLPENGSIDPNRVNANELEVVMQSLGIGVQFDAAEGLKNRRALESYDRQRGRSGEARQELATLRPRIQQLELEKARLNGEQEALAARLEAVDERLDEIDEALAEPGSEDQGLPNRSRSIARQADLLGERSELQSERLDIKTKQAENAGERTSVDQQLAVLRTQETALAADATEPTFPTEVASTQPPGGAGSNSASQLQALLSSDKIKDALGNRLNKILDNDANLHYVHELDNLLDAELQLISRRLTLLRQSVDPNYDLYFMEISASLTPFRSSKNHMARARWKVTAGDFDQKEFMITATGRPEDETGTLALPKVQKLEQEAKESCRGCQPYIFEMTPTQSALNISRHQSLSNSFVFDGAFRFLFGFGGRSHFQRQKERFGQFLEQRVFIAGHGKGSNLFGWDYAPLPGERMVAPGAYTSYAVLAVPRDRTQLTFGACADWVLIPALAGRRKPPTQPCAATSTVALDEVVRAKEEKQTHTIPLPANKSYRVNAIYYETVPQGEDVSVILHGAGFTREISVLINNVPIEPRWRLIDGRASDASFLSPSSDGAAMLSVNKPLSGSRAVRGEFEVVSSSTMILRFNCGPDFAGVPQITMVAPKHTVHLNRFQLLTAGVNGNLVRLDRIQEDFLSGKSADRVFFAPKEGWPGVRNLEFREVADDSQKAGFVLDLAGVDLSDSRTVKVFDANRPSPADTATPWGYYPLPSTEAAFLPAQRRIRFKGIPASEGRISIVVGRYQGSKTTQAEIDADTANWRLAFEYSLLPPFGPVIKNVDTLNGPAAGGNYVAITGAGLSSTDKVYFGSIPSPEINLKTDTQLRVKIPKGTAETNVKIRVVSKTVRNGRILEAEAPKDYAYDPEPKKDDAKK